MSDDAHVEAAKSIVSRIEDAILFPLMTLMMAVALLYFLWGLFQYVVNAGEGGAHEAARKHILGGVIGFVIMVSAYAILKIAASTFGIDVPE